MIGPRGPCFESNPHMSPGYHSRRGSCLCFGLLPSLVTLARHIRARSRRSWGCRRPLIRQPALFGARVAWVLGCSRSHWTFGNSLRLNTFHRCSELATDSHLSGLRISGIEVPAPQSLCVHKVCVVSPEWNPTRYIFQSRNLCSSQVTK